MFLDGQTAADGLSSRPLTSDCIDVVFQCIEGDGSNFCICKILCPEDGRRRQLVASKSGAFTDAPEKRCCQKREKGVIRLDVLADPGWGCKVLGTSSSAKTPRLSFARNEIADVAQLSSYV